MSEQIKPSVRSIVDLHHEQGGFQYGKSGATFEAVEMHKNTRQMGRKVDEIVAALDLPLTSVSGTTIRQEHGPVFVHVEGPSHDFYIHAKSPLNGESIADIVKNKPVALHIVSGSCLFSASSVDAVAHDGETFSLTTPATEITKPIAQIDIDPQLSLYETEASVRLSLFIGNLLQGKTPVESIQLNIPRVEYYNYALDAYEKGFLSPSQMLEWFDAVDTRAKRLGYMMKRRIRKYGGKKDEPLFISNQPLALLEDYIKGTVTEADIPQLDRAKKMLLLSSPLWETVLSLQNITSWVDLNNAAYVIAELQAARVPRHQNDNVHIGIAVENFTENKIFSNAKQLYEALPDRNEEYHLIGLYPHEHVVPVGENAAKTMYHIAKPKTVGLHHARTIFSAYRPMRKNP